MYKLTPGKDTTRFRNAHLKKQGGKNPRGERVGMNSFHLEWNGKPWLPVMGEFQYSRYPSELWEEELRKIKAGGVDTVPTYCFWIHHEEEEGVFDWSGRKNLRRFVQLCTKHGLWVMMRIGPFCHGEARNGGLPDWIYSKPFEVRGNDPRYLFYVKRLYTEIGRQLKGLMFKDGGPILGLQCENEFMDSVAPWETTHNTAMVYSPKGFDGLKHVRMLKRLALQAGIDAPLHTNTGWGGSPVDVREFLPMYGGYGYYAWVDDPATQEPTGFFMFRDMHKRSNSKFNSSDVPFACCEIGGGMQVFYKNRPVVPPESVEAMHVAQLGSGSNVMGYYVYHGGTNPTGKHAFLNEHRCPRISYDFQAPLGEFGQRRPHYGLLRRQFLFLKEFGERLAPMEVSITPEVANAQPTDKNVVRWVVRSREGRGFVFTHNFQDHVKMEDHDDVVFQVKAGAGDAVTLPPSGRGMSLKKEVSAILPFNFDMDGLLLKSATLQPITRIDCDRGSHYFFFAPRAFPAEYAFDTSTFADVELRGADRKILAGTALIQVKPGVDSLLTFTLPGGKKVLVTTLTDEQAKHFWKAKVAGRERVFLCESGLLFGNQEVEVYGTEDDAMTFAVYPPLRSSSNSGAGRVETATEGIFQRHTVRVPRRTVKLGVKKIADGKVAVRIPRNALKGAREVYLQIDCVADTGSAYLDGKLIHDHFWNGGIWEIALRPFTPRILETELVLVLTPLRKGGGGAKVLYTSMAAMQVTGEGDQMEFRSIKAQVERSVVLKVR